MSELSEGSETVTLSVHCDMCILPFRTACCQPELCAYHFLLLLLNTVDKQIHGPLQFLLAADIGNMHLIDALTGGFIESRVGRGFIGQGALHKITNGIIKSSLSVSPVGRYSGDKLFCLH
jgi:hypothetical protein